MTITYPRTLPDNQKLSECWFDIVDNIAMSPSSKGLFVNLSQVNDPVWKGTFLTGILERDVHPIWSAWRKSLGGGLRQFVAYDVRKSRPYAYPTANASTDISGAWDGTADVTSLGASGALGLSGLPSAYQFKVGDRIGLEEGSYHGYYEVMEDALAVAGVATVNVYPFLHTSIFTTAAVCRVWRPVCKFIIDPTSWNESGSVEKTPVSFVGYQRL